MREDIIIDEAELSIASNRIERYIDFLLNSIDEYINEIERLTIEKSIKDIEITAELNRITNEVRKVKEKLIEYDKSIRINLETSVSEIGKQDNFKFPNELVTVLKNIISVFS